MKDEHGKRRSKFSWPKSLVRKWFNIRSKPEDFAINNLFPSEMEGRKSCDRNRRAKLSSDSSPATEVRNCRVFVATWNVAGKSPPNCLSMEEWLHTWPPADLYVLGFQEIVPLNAGNVLGVEDNLPARKWTALISRTLNSLPGAASVSGGSACCVPSPTPSPIAEMDEDFEGSSFGQKQQHQSSLFSRRRSFHSLSMRVDGNLLAPPQPMFDRQYSAAAFDRRASDYESSCRWGSYEEKDDGYIFYDNCSSSGSSKYSLVASKQMVGIFLSVWVRKEMRGDVGRVKVSCVGRGLMGYLGNKGSISISLSLHQTTFCFVCTHLTSGQKEGDELRRNSDVMEILKKTRFPRLHSDHSPQTILEHDRVIWLGDLNYRISLSYRYAKALVEMRNWSELLENDQLRMEQRRGNVFEGWKEGTIYFPPTYKYSNNSDRYTGEETMNQKEKRRTPAWCDRILWFGGGLSQLSYVRGETRFSDHRPVCGTFLSEVECINSRERWKKGGTGPSSRVEVEELLHPLNSYNYGELYMY